MDLDRWISSWDRQQELYVPFREQRFDVMLAAIDDWCLAGGVQGPSVLDLACGPAAFGTRLVTHDRDARYFGVDVDPVLLHLARGLAGVAGGRLRVEAFDLLDDLERLTPHGPFHAVVSSTALHWLDEATLRRVCRAACRLLVPGGLFLNADNLSYPPPAGFSGGLARRMDVRQREAAAAAGVPTWADWWARARADAVLGPLCLERDRRFPPASDAEAPPPSLALYVEALLDAGFVEVEQLWQRFDDRVLVAVAPS